MKNRIWAFAIPAVILLAVFLLSSFLTSQSAVIDKPSKEDVAHETQEATPVNFIGHLQTLVIDEIDKTTGRIKGKFIHYIEENGKIYQIEDTKGILTKIKPSSKISLSGVMNKNKIAADSVILLSTKNNEKTDESIPETIGEQKTLVALFNYPDKLDQPFTIEDIQKEIISNTDSLNNFIKENSYGKTWLNADFIDWQTLPNNMSYYNNDTYFYWYLVDSIKTLDNIVNFQNYARLIFLYVDSYRFGAIGDIGKSSGRPSDDGNINASVTMVDCSTGLAFLGTSIAHEFGHNLGFGHAASIASNNPYFLPESLLDSTSSCGTVYNTYGDYGDTMGASGSYYKHFSTIWKTQAHWIDSSQIQEVNTSGEYTLDQVEFTSDGIKVLRIPLGKDINRDEFYYYIEYRKNKSTDTFHDTYEDVDIVQIRTKQVSADYNNYEWSPNSVRFSEQTTGRMNCTPIQVSDLGNVIAIASGSDHSMALKSDGTVWTWGNYRSEDGYAETRSTPVQVNNLSDVVAISAGGDHSLALKSDGTVWAWGYNYSGNLGDGTTETRSTPVQVNNLSDVVAISAGGWHSLALKSDGTVWTWGGLFKGYGTIEARSTPVQVNNLSDVTAIFAGESGGNFALKSDGTIWAWGVLSYGLLGDGTTTTSSTPVQAKNLSDVVAISAAGYHSLALKSVGTVWAWGKNYSGNLGDGTTETRSIPVQVNNLSDVVAISAGRYLSLALKSDGTVWAWGYNGYGQLGDGTTADSSIPIQVSDLSGIISITSRSSNILSLKSDGTVLEWGYNSRSVHFEDLYNFKDVDVNKSFSDPYRGVKVELIEKTGNDSDSKVKLKVTLSDININPEGVLSFSKSSINTTSSLSVTITNNTNEQIDIGLLSISGRNPKLFNIVSDECSNRNLEQGESCNVTISFTPDSKGEKFGILTVPNSDSIRPQATISLYGEGSETTTEEEDLLEKYAPILYMHPDERFHPTKVEVMLNYSKLYKTKKGKDVPVNLKGKELSLDLLMNTRYNKEEYYLKLIKYWDDNRDTNYWKSFPTVYGREFTVKDEENNEKIILQYWFFYIYNDWDNKHEGDWEMIQIHLSKEKQPESIIYGYHHSGESFNWTDGEVEKNGNHPIVYVTLGGHGCWTKAGDNIWYQKIKQLVECAECIDETAKGDVLYPQDFPEDEIQTSYSKYSYTLENMSKWTDKKKDWIYWEGYWGNQQFAKELTKYSDFGISGPPSPPYIDYIDDDKIAGRWDKPLEWKNDSVPSNYKICTPANTKVVVRDLEKNTEALIVEWFSERCSKVNGNANIIYTGKDILLDVYSLDGDVASIKLGRYNRITRTTYEVEFDGLEVPKNGKATFIFSPEQNPTFEIEIDHDRDGFFDSHRLPDFLEVK